MAYRIVVLDGYPSTPLQPGERNEAGDPTWEALAALGALTVYPRTPAARVIERIGEAEIVLTNKVSLDASTIRAATNLQYIGLLSTGVNAVDGRAAAEAGVTVTNIPGYSSDSVAQHVFALLLELVMQPGAHDRAVHEGRWSAGPDYTFTLTPLRELAGKTLGIVGLGAIGRRVARIGAAMGMPIAAAHQRRMNEIEIPGVPIDWQPLDALLPKADVLTLHCPLTEQTRHMIDQRRLRQMPAGSWLINTGRGSLMDEQAVAEALHAGHLAGVGVDVLSDEPPKPDNPLLHAPHCIITPHLAWATVEARQRLMAITVNNVKAFLEGAPVNVVN